MQRTNKNNQFFGHGLIITDCRVWLNRNDTAPEGRDYRIATLSICINDSLWVNNIKVFDRATDSGTWYIKLPGSFIRTEQKPNGKAFDHVRVTQEQFAILRSYAYDRVEEAQGGHDTEDGDEVESE